MKKPKLVRPDPPGEAGDENAGPTIRYRQGKITKLGPQTMDKKTRRLYKQLHERKKQA